MRILAEEFGRGVPRSGYKDRYPELTCRNTWPQLRKKLVRLIQSIEKRIVKYSNTAEVFRT